MKTITITLAIAAIFIISARAQSFLNLNFESAYNLPSHPPGSGVSVPVTNALPGWAAYDDTLLLSDVYYASNNFPGGGTAVELEGGSLALNGDFSVGLYLDGSISQTGVVPGDAESLLFEAAGDGPDYSLGASGFSVTLGGQDLLFSALSQGPSYILYGVNIPAGMDGQSEALTFGCQGVGSGNVLLDNIEFSTSSVPEPGEFGLIGLGVVLFGVLRRRGRLTAPSFAETATEGRKTA